jgi:putative nucleotidyltransferase with HDIG domain
MRFATRTFIWSFVPFAFLLLGAFWQTQRFVGLTVREGVRSSLRQTHASIARVRTKSELQDSRFLRILGENASLKAGLQLLNSEPSSAEARRTVEEQLRELCNVLGFDFLLASRPGVGVVAGVMRVHEQIVSMDIARVHPPERGFVTLAGQAYQVVSTPINQGDENIGTLSIGDRFDFSEFSTAAVLTHNGTVLLSSFPGVPLPEIESAMRGCSQGECEVRLHGETYISLPMESLTFGDGYVLRSLQSIDAANGPVQTVLRRVFVITAFGTLMATVILTVLAARGIVRPIGRVVSHLRQAEQTGVLSEFDGPGHGNSVREISQLTESFNRASRAIRDAQRRLEEAFLQFTESLAGALDARDHYTAGHSRRVSDLSCAIARAMEVPPAALEEIRMGALLHDIGKIGIADSVLQKAGPLSNEEMRLIEEHPTIGRRILEGVSGFQQYLRIVELHHENWNGTGYPCGLRGEAAPIEARIVHLADAYDAMTTDRPYRRAMTHTEAVRALQQSAGSMFDPAVVRAFVDAISYAGDVAGFTTEDQSPIGVPEGTGA